LILRTFFSVFPETEVFMDSPYYLLTVGSRCPIGGREGPTREELVASGVAGDIERTFLPDASRLDAIWVASGSELNEVIGEGPINDWNHLPLEFLSSRLPPASPAQTSETLKMILGPRIANQPGNPAFASDPYVKTLIELHLAYMEWMTGQSSDAQERVAKVLERHPDLPLAHRARQSVQLIIGKRGAGPAGDD
jgi:hypothetical protein